MAGSSTADLLLRPAREDDLDYVVAAEGDPDIDVKPHNARARALYASEGFREEGVLRDALWSGDRYESLVVMAILRPEWTG